MTIGEKLRKWRESIPLTQREAAKRAAVSQAAWCAVESDNTKRLGLEVAQKIVRATNGAISLDDFTRKARKPSAPPPKRTGTDG